MKLSHAYSCPIYYNKQITGRINPAERGLSMRKNAIPGILFACVVLLPLRAAADNSPGGRMILYGHIPRDAAVAERFERLDGNKKLKLAVGLSLRNVTDLKKLLAGSMTPKARNTGITSLPGNLHPGTDPWKRITAGPWIF